jgi:putative ABC transport system permease protein
VVTAEPDRPLDLFAFGPRVFIHSSDLDALGLMATGSRIRHVVLLKVTDPLQVDAIAARLKQAAPVRARKAYRHLPDRRIGG